MLNKLKKLSVIHPFLFAIFPILFLFAYNIYEVHPTDLLLPMVVVIAGTLILFFSLRLVTKNYNKSGIITSFFLILFFSYGHIRDLVYHFYHLQRFNPQNPGSQTINLFLASLWVLLFIAVAFLVTRSRSNFRIFTKFLNIVAITLVTISLINISIGEIRTINLGHEKANEEGSVLDLSNTGNLPDIYYIILDEYAGQDTLKEVFDYDNSEFANYLTDKGFYVASKSCSNYSTTHGLLASSLNMEYITARKTLPELIQMWQNNKVSQFLKSKGYRYIFVGFLMYPLGMSKYADVYGSGANIRIMSNFTTCLIRSTALAPFVTYFASLESGAPILASFDSLAGIPNIKEPTFVYAHILCPHIPFVFDRYGNPVTQPTGRPRFLVYPALGPWTLEEGREKYVDQLIFVNKKVEAVVDEILSKSDVPPIIILQGDHGTRWEKGREHDILNAYFLPGKDYDLLYESISPVNSFRIVFNLYFDTDYELLEDESY